MACQSGTKERKRIWCSADETFQLRQELEFKSGVLLKSIDTYPAISKNREEESFFLREVPAARKARRRFNFPATRESVTSCSPFGNFKSVSLWNSHNSRRKIRFPIVRGVTWGTEDSSTLHVNAAASNFQARSNFEDCLSNRNPHALHRPKMFPIFPVRGVGLVNFKVTWKRSNAGSTGGAFRRYQQSSPANDTSSPSRCPARPSLLFGLHFYQMNERRTNTLRG